MTIHQAEQTMRNYERHNQVNLANYSIYTRYDPGETKAFLYLSV